MNKNNKTRHALAGLLLGGLCSLLPVQQAQAQTFCVFDPLGQGGDYYSMFQDYQLAAKRWGVQIDLKVYPDDQKLDDAFKSGECDMASMIGIRARTYNQFTGSIDSPSTVENYVELREVMNLMASPKLSKYMVSGDYEVVGMVPVGAAYAVVNDRYINSLEHGAGKRIAMMKWDKSQPIMAEYFKSVPVMVDITQFGDYFNHNKVDFVVVPLAVYKALELSKGVGSKGGIVRRPMLQFTMQLVAHNGKFPADFGQKSREYMLTQTDHALSLARNMEASIDNRLWIYAVRSEVTEWNNSMRGLLNKLVQMGFYDKRMLTLLKRIRCSNDKEEPECAPTVEQAREAGHP